MKRLSTFLLLAAGMLFATQAAFAHAIVTPKQVGIGAEQAFVLGVPDERSSSVVAVRLLVPGGVQDVVPTVKSGWAIAEVKSAAGDVTEIRWTGGRIPVGQRDEFGFSAQVPATPTTLAWKAYQAYADGTLVSWDQVPVPDAPDQDDVTVGPYSETQVVDDLSPAPVAPKANPSTLDQVAIAFSAAALGVSVVSSRRRSSKPPGAPSPQA
jgi:uncharacterized protein YcnI